MPITEKETEGITTDEEAKEEVTDHYSLFKPYRIAAGGLISQQVGAPSYEHTNIGIDAQYADPMGRLQEIMSGENWEGINRQAQYEALAGISPGKAITGAVSSVGSRAGGQVAEARKMSDIQMVQALSGAKVEVEKQKIQTAIAASGEIRNIMQQQLSAWAATEGMGLEAQDRLQNLATHFHNMMSMELEALINSNAYKTGEYEKNPDLFWEDWGAYQKKKWNEWVTADESNKNDIASKMGFNSTEGHYGTGGDYNVYLEEYSEQKRKAAKQSGGTWVPGKEFKPYAGEVRTYGGGMWVWNGTKWVEYTGGDPANYVGGTDVQIITPT